MICRSCQKDLPDQDFAPRMDTAAPTRRKQCKSCYAVEQRTRRDRGSLMPDPEQWWKLRRPWPWPAGVNVFGSAKR